MALRKLLARKKLDEQRKLVKALEARANEMVERVSAIEKRETDAVAAVEELTDEASDEDRKAVEDEADEIDAEKAKIEEDKAALEKEKSELEAKIAELEAELAEEDLPAEPKPERAAQTATKHTRRNNMESMANKFETRSDMIERLNVPEVRSFYTELAGSIREKRAVSNGALVIPEEVINAIDMRIGDYAKVAPLVRTVRLGGTGRVLLAGTTPEGIWVEQEGALSELNFSFGQIELDGWKVGGYVAVPNSLLEDSFIDLANYLETQLAQAIAKAKDKAILKGTGSTGKQPEGIVPNVTNTATPADLAELLAEIATIDDGVNVLGELTAVMNRSTYYKWIQPETLLSTSAGQLAVQNANGAVLPDGTKIVFSNYAGANEVIIGDFYNGYILAERAGVQMARSEHVKFIEDQTAFKATYRCDGKLADEGLFLVATMTAAA